MFVGILMVMNFLAFSDYIIVNFYTDFVREKDIKETIDFLSIAGYS